MADILWFCYASYQERFLWRLAKPTFTKIRGFSLWQYHNYRRTLAGFLERGIDHYLTQTNLALLTSRRTGVWYKCKFNNRFSGRLHKFHILDSSPWPILSSFSALMFTFSMVFYMHNSSDYAYNYLIISFFSVLLVMILWWRDVIRESTYLGYHTKKVQSGLRYGVMFFIASEVMFFFAFFWAFFHSSLSPSVALGSVWPPVGINVLNPLQLPLLNTLILLLSGITITWSHHNIRGNGNFAYFRTREDIFRDGTLLLFFTKNRTFSEIYSMNFMERLQEATFPLFLTILLGIEFTAWQGYEYYKASFYIYDGIYGSTFYMTTGLHGLHVIIGTLFLFVCLIRMLNLHFVKNHHFGYEAAIWYWHFVDVVWVFLFLSIYCWGSGVDNIVLPSLSEIYFNIFKSIKSIFI